MTRYLALGLFLSLLVSSCSWYNQSVMMKTPKDYEFDVLKDSIDNIYKISVDDKLTFRLFANDGFKLIDLTSYTERPFNSALDQLEFPVEFDGQVKLPILGRVQLKGMTVREAEEFLEKEYAAYYNKPFVMLSVLNRRVYIFPGADGAAKVIPLENENTTLLEALAAAGGITSTGKAKEVKLLRGQLSDPEVYHFDLSTIEGVTEADLVLQANDIIYVDPSLNITRETLQEVTPIVSLLTSLVIVIAAINRI